MAYDILAENQEIISKLPSPREFSQALYTFDIGQNDLAYGFQHTTVKEARASIPDILAQFSKAVHVSEIKYSGHRHCF